MASPLPPAHPDALSQALALHRSGDLSGAEALYRAALASYPQDVTALNLLGTVYVQQGDAEKGIGLMEQAIALKPDYWNAYYDRGVALLIVGRHHDALASFEQTIALKPDDAEAWWNTSLIKLLLGEYEEGWARYEWRWKRGRKDVTRTFQTPLWLGKELLANQTLLLHAEQGYGDTIQFCRYIPMVAAKANRIVFECFGSLAHLMRHNYPNVDVVERASDFPGTNGLPEHDRHTPLMSLPHLFNTTLASIPSAPYLKAPPEYIEKWRPLLNEKTQSFRIGLCWAGGQHAARLDCLPIDARRSLHFKQLKPLLDVKNTMFISLQLGPPQFQRDDERVQDISSQIESWSDTAAIISLLDLVISADTSVCHLAAAMGRDTFLLNRYDTCWRWLLNRDDSPWYPSLTQFRQKTPGDWSDVIERVKIAVIRKAE